MIVKIRIFKVFPVAQPPKKRMQPSNIAKEVSRLLLPFIREQASRAGAEYNDPINSVIRRCYHLSKFNILKLEGLTYAPLNGQIRDKIKICALPFKDLPSAKLEGITY